MNWFSSNRIRFFEFSPQCVLFLKQTEERINYMSKYDEDEEADVSIFIKLTIALGFDGVVCQNFYTTSNAFHQLNKKCIYCMNR